MKAMKYIVKSITSPFTVISFLKVTKVGPEQVELFEDPGSHGLNMSEPKEHATFLPGYVCY